MKSQIISETAVSFRQARCASTYMHASLRRTDTHTHTHMHTHTTHTAHKTDANEHNYFTIHKHTYYAFTYDTKYKYATKTHSRTRLFIHSLTHNTHDAYPMDTYAIHNERRASCVRTRTHDRRLRVLRTNRRRKKNFSAGILYVPFLWSRRQKEKVVTMGGGRGSRSPFSLSA